MLSKAGKHQYRVLRLLKEGAFIVAYPIKTVNGFELKYSIYNKWGDRISYINKQRTQALFRRNWIEFYNRQSIIHPSHYERVYTIREEIKKLV
jgi:hypothetical protein